MIQPDIIRRYKEARSKLVLLDYDGTLVGFTPAPADAKPSDKVLKTLHKLIATPGTDVVIISGRKPEDLDMFLGHLPIDIIGEHGAMHKTKSKWTKAVTADDGLWKKEVLTLFNKFTRACPGSFIEAKEFSIGWHYRNAETADGYWQSRNLIRLLNDIRIPGKLKITDGNKLVEVSAGIMNKGKAVKALLKENNYDVIICIGDDKTDEDMFKCLAENEQAITIKVGSGETEAKCRLNSVDDVLNFLAALP